MQKAVYIRKFFSARHVRRQPNTPDNLMLALPSKPQIPLLLDIPSYLDLDRYIQEKRWRNMYRFE